jgi:hypothetical protein
LALGGPLFGTAASAAPLTHSYIEGGIVGSVRATLKYDFTPNFDDELNDFQNVRLEIFRGGVSSYSGPVFPNGNCPDECRRLERSPEHHSLTLRLSADNEPEVGVHIWSGGAACCSNLYVFWWDGTSYRRAVLEGGRGGIKFVNHERDGRVEIEAGDERFTCAYTACAFSARPLKIFSFENGRFRNVTRRYPQVIRGDAAKAWSF